MLVPYTLNIWFYCISQLCKSLISWKELVVLNYKIRKFEKTMSIISNELEAWTHLVWWLAVENHLTRWSRPISEVCRTTHLRHWSCRTIWTQMPLGLKQRKPCHKKHVSKRVWPEKDSAHPVQLYSLISLCCLHEASKNLEPFIEKHKSLLWK